MLDYKDKIDTPNTNKLSDYKEELEEMIEQL